MTGSPLVRARLRELGRCLRAHRDLLAPAARGLPVGGRRRTPGLRREEVAALSGVGLTWYTWLEQGRVVASDQVLDAVGRVLGVDEAGREHLRALTRPPAPSPSGDPTALRPLLESLADHPAVLLDARSDVTAVTDAWIDSFGRPTGGHLLEPLLTAPDGPDDDVAPLVRAVARRLRMASDHAPTDERLARVRAAARTRAPALAAVWACRAVGSFGRPTVRLGGVRRTAYLLGEAGGAGTGDAAVLVLLPATGAGAATVTP